MSAAQSKSSEPSMEEILASIRKIISDDTGAKPAAPAAAAPPPAINPLPPAPVAPPAAPIAAPPAPPAAVVEEDEDVMDLMPMPAAKPMAPPVAAAPAPQVEILDDDDGADVQFQAPKPVAPAPLQRQATDSEALMARTEFSPTPAAPTEHLMSSNTDRVVSTAFSTLSTTVLNNNGRTLDSVVEDMMRPMIKGWLDDNLPGIVERLIKAEIERVARGGR